MSEIRNKNIYRAKHSYLVLVFYVGGLAQPIFGAVLPDRLQGLKPEPVNDECLNLVKQL